VVSIAALTRTLKARRAYVALYRTVAGALAGSALAIAAVGLTDWAREARSSRWFSCSFFRSQQVCPSGCDIWTLLISRSTCSDLGPNVRRARHRRQEEPHDIVADEVLDDRVGVEQHIVRDLVEPIHQDAAGSATTPSREPLGQGPP
jgi:hypothetical protein